MNTRSIESTRFGKLDITDDKVIRFVEPILGFESLKEFTLLDHQEDSPFNWLQSLEDPDLAFVVTNPKLFGIPYEFAIPEEMVTKLALTSGDDALVLTIVNVPADAPRLMTANLLGPIVVNRQNLYAMQVILSESEYNTKTRLIPDEETSPETDNPTAQSTSSSSSQKE